MPMIMNSNFHTKFASQTRNDKRRNLQIVGSLLLVVCLALLCFTESQTLSAVQDVNLSQGIQRQITTNLRANNDMMTSQQKQQGDGYVCLDVPYWGQLNNQIISIALALRQARRKNTKLVLVGRKYHRTFINMFESHPEIINRNGLPYPEEASRKCILRLDGEGAYYIDGGPHKSKNYFVPELMELKVLQSIRDEAMEIIKRKYNNEPFISVHRRWLDGECHDRARKRENFGNVDSCSAEMMKTSCDWTYSDISNPQNKTIVLFSDNQMPKMDATFPVRDEVLDEHGFKLQMWMMVQSEVHYGNPGSSVDWVIMHWRHQLRKEGTMEPSSCYPIIEDKDETSARVS